jgi:NAD+ kinase
MSSPVRRLGLVLKLQDDRVHRILSEAVPWLEARGVEVFFESASAQTFSMARAALSAREFASRIDMACVFGGDGTLLHAARLVGGSGVPILGVNLGALGFLTEVNLEDLHAAFEKILSGRYHLESRMMLRIEVYRGSETAARCLALNDAVINKGAISRMIELEVSVNSQVVTVTRADGLIISTPTGSTAYSLSAGGPILYPTLEAFIITPICPHTLTNRPVVVPDEAVVDLKLRHGSDVMLTVDGQVGLPLQAGDTLKVLKAEASIRLVQLGGSAFFRLLREKLKWG